MQTSFAGLLADSATAPLIGYTCYDLEVAEAVLAAAEDRSRAVLLLVSAQAFAGRAGARLMSALVAACEQTTAPAGVQLDHCRSRDDLRRAAELGACAVMADGSASSFAENLAFARAVVDELGDTAVEAELGRLDGEEDVASAARAGGLTDPDEVTAFVAGSGVAALGVSIGNVHGEYRDVPDLDWARLRAIKQASDVPLTLHGASGLPVNDISRALDLGIRKINVNTDLRKAYLSVRAGAEGWNVLALHRAQTAAITPVVLSWLDVHPASDPQDR